MAAVSGEEMQINLLRSKLADALHARAEKRASVEVALREDAAADNERRRLESEHSRVLDGLRERVRALEAELGAAEEARAAVAVDHERHVTVMPIEMLVQSRDDMRARIRRLEAEAAEAAEARAAGGIDWEDRVRVLEEDVHNARIAVLRLFDKYPSTKYSDADRAHYSLLYVRERRALRDFKMAGEHYDHAKAAQEERFRSEEQGAAERMRGARTRIDDAFASLRGAEHRIAQMREDIRSPYTLRARRAAKRALGAELVALLMR